MLFTSGSIIPSLDDSAPDEAACDVSRTGTSPCLAGDATSLVPTPCGAVTARPAACAKWRPLGCSRGVSARSATRCGCVTEDAGCDVLPAREPRSRDTLSARNVSFDAGADSVAKCLPPLGVAKCLPSLGATSVLTGVSISLGSSRLGEASTLAVSATCGDTARLASRSVVWVISTLAISAHS